MCYTDTLMYRTHPLGARRDDNDNNNNVHKRRLFRSLGESGMAHVETLVFMDERLERARPTGRVGE